VVHTAKLVPAFDALIARVAGIKARGDRAAARHLLKRYVHGSVVPWTVIVKRLQRFPQGSYVYALTL
jgi:hypothetical protein